jgi:hypothetical protein
VNEKIKVFPESIIKYKFNVLIYFNSTLNVQYSFKMVLFNLMDGNIHYYFKSINFYILKNNENSNFLDSER